MPPQVQAVLGLMMRSPAQAVGEGDVVAIRAALHTAAVSSRVTAPRADGVRWHDETVTVHCWVRMYEPAARRPGPPLLFVHGGGWAICDVDTHHELACQLTADTGRPVASVEYRLAPEHPYPAALEDCRAAARWLADRTGADAIVVAGDSSGGNLAAALALAAADDPQLPRIALQVLLYPVVDDDFDSASFRALGDGRFGLSAGQMRWYWDAYAPSARQRSDPLAAPGRAKDLSRVAAALIVVGDLDPLLDSVRSYARALAAAGVSVQLREYRGGFHGFYSFRGVLDLADEAAADVARAIGGSV